VDEFIHQVIHNRHCICGTLIQAQRIMGVGLALDVPPRRQSPPNYVPALVAFSCKGCDQYRALHAWIPFAYLMQLLEDAYEAGAHLRQHGKRSVRPRPELPGWILQTLEDCLCHCCGAEFTPESVMGLSMTQPASDMREVNFFVIVRCACNNTQQMLPAPVLLDDFLDGVRMLEDFIANKHEKARPQFPFDAPTRKLVRPSLPPFHPVDGPSERELRVFLNKLKRTSFRVGTKSLREFFRRLGIDIDRPFDDESDDSSGG